MPADPAPTLTVSVTLVLPASLILPVVLDQGGNRVPSTGFVWQKYLDREQLEAWGVKLSWQDDKGNILDQATVDLLLSQAQARDTIMHAANQLSSHDPS
jgi:hypothetical protein